MRRFFLVCTFFLPLLIWGFEDIVDLSTGELAYEVIDIKVDGIVPLELTRTSDQLQYSQGSMIHHEYDQERRLVKIHAVNAWIKFDYQTTSPYNYQMHATTSDGQNLTYYFTQVSQTYKLIKVESQGQTLEELFYASNGQLIQRKIESTLWDFAYYQSSGKVKSVNNSDGLAFSFLYGKNHSEVIDQNYQRHLYDFDPSTHALVKIDHILTGDRSYSESFLPEDLAMIAQIEEEIVETPIEIAIEEPTLEEIAVPIAVEEPMTEEIELLSPVYMALTGEIVFDEPYQVVKTNIRGEPTHIVFQDGNEAHFTYYSDGSYETYRSKEGLTTYFSHDPLGRKPSRYVKSADGKFLYKESYMYDTTNLIAMTDAVGNHFSYSYDDAGRKIKEETLECTITYEYDDADRITLITKIRDKDIALTTFSWNAEGQLETEVHLDKAENVLTTLSKEYDHNDRLIKVLHTSNNETLEETYEYDYNGRLAKHHKIDGTIIAYNYLKSGFEYIETNPQGFQIVKTYDADDCLSLVEQYDPQNTLVKTVRNEYDNLNRHIEKHEKAGKGKEKSTYYFYDTFGRLEKSCDEKDNEIFYTYDQLGHLASLTTADGALSYAYEYDFLGKLKKITDNYTQEVTTRTYDSYGKLLTETFGHGFTVERSYDAKDAHKQLTLPDETLLEYAYAGNKLQSITRKHPSGSMISTMFYTNHSEDEIEHHLLLSNLSQKNAIRKPLNTYDLLGRLVEVTYPKMSKYTFRYDGLGRCLTETEFVWTQEKIWKQKHTRHYFYDDLKEIGYTNETGRIQDIYNLDSTKSGQHEPITVSGVSF